MMVQLDTALYWELRTRILEHDNLIRQQQAQAEQSKQAIQAFALKAGLDLLQGEFRLDDATCSATLVASEVAKDPAS